MAIIVSPIASHISGSIGNITYQTNQHHQIIARARPSPIFVPSTRRNNYLVARTWAYNQWLALPESTRVAWSAYSESLTIKKNGTAHHPNGHHAFMGSLTCRRYIKLQCLDPFGWTAAAPTTLGRIHFRIDGPYPPSAGTGFLYTIINPNPFPILVLRIGADIQSITRNRWHGPYKLLADYKYISPNSSFTFDFITGILNDVHFYRFRACTLLVAHRLSPMLYLRCVCVPAA